MANTNFEKQIKNMVEGLDEGELENLDYNEEPEMLPVVYENKPTNVQEFSNEDLKEDYEFARSNLYGLIGKANASVELLLKIAQSLENASALEVATGLIETSSKLTKDLLSLQKNINTNQPPKKEKGVYNQYNFNVNGGEGRKEKTVSATIDELPDE